jgi:hypothetical protein
MTFDPRNQQPPQPPQQAWPPRQQAQPYQGQWPPPQQQPPYPPQYQQQPQYQVQPYQQPYPPQQWQRPGPPPVTITRKPITFAEHLFHLFMCFPTCGLWAIVWISRAVAGREERTTYYGPRG